MKFTTEPPEEGRAYHFRGWLPDEAEPSGFRPLLTQVPHPARTDSWDEQRERIRVERSVESFDVPAKGDLPPSWYLDLDTWGLEPVAEGEVKS